MGRLTFREALASNRLDVFVREQQDDGAELITGSQLERGLSLLITQRRSLTAEDGSATQQHCGVSRQGCRERRGSRLASVSHAARSGHRAEDFVAS